MHHPIQLIITASSRRTSISQSSLFRRTLLISPLASIVLLFLLSAASTSLASSATWNLNPPSGDWNTAENWTPAIVPNGPSDTATFALSNTTRISISADTVVDGIIFDPNASSFDIIAMPNFILTISGTGITNNSGTHPILETGYDVGNPGATIVFSNSATAGNAFFYLNFNGQVSFQDSSTAGDAFIAIFEAGLEFSNSSTAGNAEIENIGSLVFLNSATAGNASINTDAAANTIFLDTSSAGNAIMGSEDTGHLGFFDSSTAGNANISSLSFITFYESSDGGTSRITVFPNDDFGGGGLDIRQHDGPGVTVGSIEGPGYVYLGANQLVVGRNHLSTTFSGVIRDTGSLRKIGKGTFTLTGANSYTGGTVIQGGVLLANNPTGSGTGSGLVQAKAGTFGGGGTVAGAVIVGTGRGRGAILAPGADGSIPGTLTIQNKLMLLSDATYRVLLNSATPATDKVTANEIRIRGAQVLFGDRDPSVLPPGTVFTVIENTAVISINGTFSNLADGTTITVGSNTFQVSYEGGDGNDLTLTVVP